jgi:hypothetical protein
MLTTQATLQQTYSYPEAIDDPINMRLTFPTSSLVFSPCGYSGLLNVNLRVVASKSGADGYAQFSGEERYVGDETSSAVTETITRWAWQKC